MRLKVRKVVSDQKSDTLAADDTSFAIKGRPIRLAVPPEEIADEGQVRLGCSMLSGKFPAIR